MEEEVVLNTLENLEPNSAAFGVLAGFGFAALIVGFVVLILTIIAMWRIFTKAGEKGWKSIIPIYNTYVLFRIAGRNFWKYFLILLVVNIVGSIASGTTGILSIILSVLVLAGGIWAIVEFVEFLHGLSTNFGHGKGFTVGLFFLNTIFMLILGLGSSQYKGNTSVSAS